MRTTPLVLLVLAVTAALVVGGCGSSTAKQATTAAAASAAPKCPAAWVAGWRRLARRIDAPVYCPTWLPQPLDGRIGGEYAKGPFYGSHGSYLVPMIWFE